MLKKPKPENLKTKYAIFQLILANSELYKWQKELSNPPYYQRGYFVVDSQKYFIYVQRYVRNPSRLDCIILEKESGKRLTNREIDQLKERLSR